MDDEHRKIWPEKGKPFDPDIHIGRPAEPGNVRRRAENKINRKFREEMQELLATEVQGKAGNTSTVARALLEVGITKALEGDFRFWRYIIEMHDGPIAPQLTGAPSGDDFDISPERLEELNRTLGMIQEAVSGNPHDGRTPICLPEQS